MDYFKNPKFQVEFNGSYLKPARGSFAPSKTINLYITFQVKSWSFYVGNGFILRNSLFAVKSTKNADPEKYSYSGHDIWFDERKSFSLPNDTFWKNVIIFGADMSSSGHAHN